MIPNILFDREVIYELLKELSKLCSKSGCFKKKAHLLKRSVEQLMPIIRELQYTGMELPQCRQALIAQLAEKLQQGLELAQKASASSRWNVLANHQLCKKMEKLQKSISKLLNGPFQVHIMAEVRQMRVDLGERFERLERRLGNGGDGEDRARFLEELVKRVEDEREGVNGGNVGNGMRVGTVKVKEMLIWREDLKVVGISGIGGSGKTTLAKEICRDNQIRSYFSRIVFETVSQSPNLEHLKLKILEQILGTRSSTPFEATPQWKILFEVKTSGPTLVVLDDVWSIAQLEQLTFNIPGLKTLVLSRFRFPAISDCTYEAELLKEEEALSLFCYHAFQQESIPLSADRKLVNQVVAECKGLPLALKVIGSSLRGQPRLMWESAKNRLSKGELISESHEYNLLARMAITVDSLSPKVRECFLDLGCFIEDRKIPIEVLINMWVETHDLEEVDAFAVLVELSHKNLLTLVKDTMTGDIDCCYNDISVKQHDALRDLALHMANQEAVSQRKRLVMPRRDDKLPKEWQRNKDEPFNAAVVSIHTGEMKECDWFDMQFPNVEVLMLNFASGTFFLPPFIKNMPKLKSLVLLNYGNSTAVLHNLSVFSSLSCLRSLYLEKIKVPPLPETTLPLPSLEKISLVLCDLDKSLNASLGHIRLIFPQLSDLAVDHSLDLKELPSSICEVQTLKSLSITNCHDLIELPPQLGRLSSLQTLRLYACPLLTKLPQSICGLKRLKYLDISRCVNLGSLPEGIGQLLDLEKIDMRECSLIMDLPLSALSLSSLEHVICDEDIAFAWKEAEKMIPELRVQVAEERFTLDWLVE